MATPDKYLTRADLHARYGVRRGWLERRMRQSNFPRPVRLGGAKLRFWRESEVLAWEANAQNHPRPACNAPGPA
jgi:predicted DNA-binding transcriptional regulator AlpA